MRIAISTLIVAGLPLLTSTCSPTHSPQAEQQTVSSSKITLDDQLIKIAERVPGFGGMFFDEQGDLNVYMVGTETLTPTDQDSQKARVTEGLTAVLGKEFLLQGQRTSQQVQPSDQRPPEVKIVQGAYDIPQLVRWRTNVDQVLGTTGVVLTDLDEARNRLKVGVAPGTSIEPVKDILTRAGVPLEAVIIEEAKPIVFLSSVRDKHRPVGGGIQVEIDTGIFGYTTCTLGFVAVRLGQRGFVTNSHCTESRGSLDGSSFHQPNDPLLSEGNKIGDEIADPGFFTGGLCPVGRRCRYSDSAFVRLDVANGATVARTTSSDGSLTVDDANPTFNIVGENPNPFMQVVLHKVGRTTGWTFGSVTSTCANVNPANTDITLICQTVVVRTAGSHKIADHGDSGSPVFFLSDNGITLWGLLWGASEDGSHVTFSPMTQIEQELGDLTTFNFTTPPPPICPVERPICCEPTNGGCSLCIATHQSCP